jgi:hypothetical protein
MFRPGFTSPTLLEDTLTRRYGTFTLSGPAFHPVLLVCQVLRVRSPLLTESLLLPFPVATEMFHFATFAPSPYAFR